MLADSKHLMFLRGCYLANTVMKLSIAVPIACNGTGRAEGMIKCARASGKAPTRQTFHLLKLAPATKEHNLIL
jgi:hypothetical protein